MFLFFGEKKKVTNSTSPLAAVGVLDLLTVFISAHHVHCVPESIVNSRSSGLVEVGAGATEETDFGQSRFGHPDLTNFGSGVSVVPNPEKMALTKFGQTKFGQDQVWPDQVWPTPSLAKSKFGQDQVWPGMGQKFVFQISVIFCCSCCWCLLLCCVCVVCLCVEPQTLNPKP